MRATFFMILSLPVCFAGNTQKVEVHGAAFIRRRYGWKWGASAYAVASDVGWSRV
jgi:hypothetical protein